MIAREPRTAAGARSAGEHRLVLCARSVSRSFGDEHAVRGLDLDLRAGEVHALVGLNGAGKTTAMRLLLGMLRPDGGTVSVDVGSGPLPAGHRAARSGVGHLVETPFSYAELTVRETVVAAARLQGLDRHAAAVAADRAVEALALTHWSHRRSRTLSLGNRQRLGLACAVVHEPGLLVLDEPSNALDPAGVLVVRRALADATARGAAVLVSSHHLDEVARTADRITVMHRGLVIGTLPSGETDLERRFFAMVAAWDGVGTEPTAVDRPAGGTR